MTRPSAPVSDTSPPGSVVVNLHPDPRLRGQVKIRQAHLWNAPGPNLFALGRHIYSHLHARAEVVAGTPFNEVRVDGRTDANDAYICPGGRDGAGLRLRMRPGHTYTFAATLRLDAPLTGVLHEDTRRIVVDWRVDGDRVRAAQRSAAARNLAGRTRLAVTFTVPSTATEAWIRLVSGAAQGHGTVWWSDFGLTETSAAVPNFDGADPDDDRHVHSWRGKANESPSVRTLRPVDDPAVAAQWLCTALDERDLEDVAALLSSGFAFDPDVSAYAGSLLAGAEGDELAERARLAAVAAGPYYVRARLRLADLSIRRRDWARAIEILTPLTNSPDTPAEVFYRLGRAQAGQRDPDIASQVIRAGVPRDTDVDPRVRDALLATPDLRHFVARADIWALVESAIDEIRARAASSLEQARPRRPRVFSFWAQGAGSAPPVTAACLRRMRDLYPGDELAVLTTAEIRYWVDLPRHITERVGENHTHLSDLLRLELLKRYGGYWIDATCWLTGPLPRLEELAPDADFVALRHSRTRIASWLFGAHNTSYIVHMLSAALAVYWDRHDELIDYFLLHHTFEVLINLDERFAQEWERTPDLDAGPPHDLQAIMRDPYDAATFHEVENRSFVHKLTYKLLGVVDPDWTVSALVRGEVEASRRD